MPKRRTPPILDIPIFRHQVVLCLTPAHWAWVKHENPDAEDAPAGAAGHTLGLYHEHGAGVVVIRLEDSPSGRGVDTVCHEAVHAATFILQAIRETEPTHEVLAYLAGYIAGWVHEQITD